MRDVYFCLMLEDKNTSKTELRNLGEFALIEYLTKTIKPKNNSTLLGIGDDSAVVKYGKNPSLISTDLLIEGIHFDLSYMPLKHLGYKAIIIGDKGIKNKKFDLEIYEWLKNNKNN